MIRETEHNRAMQREIKRIIVTFDYPMPPGQRKPKEPKLPPWKKKGPPKRP